ncbi:MAG: hypothetical protein LCH34_12775 [Firmicutes bacterium]|nr:hypothetical protein [Bacillota bacterium]
MKQIKLFRILLVWTLMIAMTSSSFVFAADTSVADGKTIGTAVGTFDGDLKGREDANAGKVNNYLSALYADAMIISRYSLANDTATFQTEFIKAYKDSFQTAYQAGYRAVILEKYMVPVEGAYDDGLELGTVQGQVSAMIDFTQSNKNDWLKAYNAYVGKGSLITRYNLLRESATYIDGFSNGYKEGFMKAYVETYQLKNLEAEIRNKNALQMTMLESTLTFDEEIVSFNLGEMGSEFRTSLTLEVPAAAIYQPTYLAMFKTQDTFGYRSAGLTPVSSKYTLSVWNSSGSMTLKKPITLSFEYYGSERAGIYQWINNRWVYQYTTLTDGALSITIPAGYYNGGEYAIFIDETYKIVSDISFNWAFKEIYTLMRRDVISDNSLYMPNAKITKGQLAQMIYQVQALRSPLLTDAPVIADSAALGIYKDAAEYMVGKRYMTLDAQGRFNPGAMVSYADLEYTMSMIFTRTVNWSEVSSKMLTEKFTKSPGTTNKAAYMTKAEAAYMLIYFFR